LKIHLHAIGCRLNQAEIETMARQLAAGGHTLTTDPAEADTVILNTCAVTAEAASSTAARERSFCIGEKSGTGVERSTQATRCR